MIPSLELAASSQPRTAREMLVSALLRARTIFHSQPSSCRATVPTGAHKRDTLEILGLHEISLFGYILTSLIKLLAKDFEVNYVIGTCTSH